MITIQQNSIPYLIFGPTAAVTGLVTLVKGINSIFYFSEKKQASQDNNQTESSRLSFKSLFSSCAWFGLSAFSTYVTFAIGKSFINLTNHSDVGVDIRLYTSDIESFNDYFFDVQTSSTSLNAFCLACYRSSMAYESIDLNIRPPFSIFRGDTRWKTIRSALEILEVFKRNAADLRKKLHDMESKYQFAWKEFKERVEHMEVARGISVNFAQLCETPFSFLAPTTCSKYYTFKGIETEHRKISAQIDTYERIWSSPHQLKKCQAAFKFNSDFNKILSRESVDELELSRRSFLGRMFGP